MNYKSLVYLLSILIHNIYAYFIYLIYFNFINNIRDKTYNDIWY